METKHFIGFTVLLVIMYAILAGFSFAQTSPCVIVDKQGSLVTMSCPGQGTTVQDLGGVADRYKVGDTVYQPNQFQSQGIMDHRSQTDPRSGRR